VRPTGGAGDATQGQRVHLDQVEDAGHLRRGDSWTARLRGADIFAQHDVSTIAVALPGFVRAEGVGWALAVDSGVALVAQFQLRPALVIGQDLRRWACSLTILISDAALDDVAGAAGTLAFLADAAEALALLVDLTPISVIAFRIAPSLAQYLVTAAGVRTTQRLVVSGAERKSDAGIAVVWTVNVSDHVIFAVVQ